MLSVDVAPVLSGHRIEIYHAHHLLDVRHYFRQGGILSRQVLTQQGTVTPFFTDDADKTHGVFDAVFFNIRDLGVGCKNGKGIANSYGPILFVLDPVALTAAKETIVSTQPISKLSMGESLHEISTVDDLNGVFIDDTRMIRSDVKYIELICKTPVVPLTHVQEIVVDPIKFNGKDLVDIVQTEFASAGLNRIPVRKRDLSTDGTSVFNSLMDWIAGSQGQLDAVDQQPESVQNLYKNQRRDRMLLYAGRIWESVMRHM